VLSTENGWTKVKFKNTVGWIISRYLKHVGQKTYITDEVEIPMRSSNKIERYPSNLLKVLPSYTQIELLLTEDGWSKIRLDNQEGWIISKYLTSKKPEPVIPSIPNNTWVYNNNRVYNTSDCMDEDDQSSDSLYDYYCEDGDDYYSGLGEIKFGAFYPKEYLQALKDSKVYSSPGKYEMGLRYLSEWGDDIKRRKGFDLIVESATEGYAEAQYKLASLHSSEDLKEAFIWYEKAAAQGHAESQYEVGAMYHYGEGIPQDFQKAIKWYTKAALQNQADAQYELGQMYSSGQGVSIDYKKAIKWYGRAAEQNDTRASNKVKHLLALDEKKYSDSEEFQKYIDLKHDFVSRIGSTLNLTKGDRVKEFQDEINWEKMTLVKISFKDLSDSSGFYGSSFLDAVSNIERWIKYQKNIRYVGSYAELMKELNMLMMTPEGQKPNLKYFHVPNANFIKNNMDVYGDPEDAEWIPDSDEIVLGFAGLIEAHTSADALFPFIENNRRGESWVLIESDSEFELNKIVQSISNYVNKASTDKPMFYAAIKGGVDSYDTKHQVNHIIVDIKSPEIYLKQSIFLTVNKSQVQISGIIKDDSKISELTIFGSSVPIDKFGKFNTTLYVPIGKSNVMIEALDVFENKSSKVVTIVRNKTVVKAKDKRLVPPMTMRNSNPNAVALIIGVDKYESITSAPWAESDALVFYDYAQNALGISNERIRLITGSESSESGIWKSIERWLPTEVDKNTSDVYVYFAGHGLASADGNNAYLIPWDGDPDLLARTAILRSELIDGLKDLDARNVTLFMDTCYSGKARGGKGTLVADSRGLRIVKKDKLYDLPSNFTLFSAAGNDETASSHPSLKHGLFSYWMMRGLGGDADINSDRKITNGELHAFIDKNVQKSAVSMGRKQHPQLVGDKDKVISSW
jgi:TPR repeat protein